MGVEVGFLHESLFEDGFVSRIGVVKELDVRCQEVG